MFFCTFITVTLNNQMHMLSYWLRINTCKHSNSQSFFLIKDTWCFLFTSYKTEDVPFVSV